MNYLNTEAKNDMLYINCIINIEKIFDLIQVKEYYDPSNILIHKFDFLIKKVLYFDSQF